MNNFDIIIKKLEAFTKRYYLFKIARGLFFILGLYIFIILLESLVEYFNYLNVVSKTIIFYISITSFAVLFIYYILLPVLSLFKLRNHLSFADAAKIISQHFPDIKDKLLNALELNQINSNVSNNPELILASINQRTDELSPLPFRHAINFSYVKRNLVFFVASVFVLSLILAFSPKILVDGTARLVDYSKYYEPEAPFKFVLLNNNLICEKGKDFTVKLKVTGDYIPEDMFIRIGDNKFMMNPGKQLAYYQFELRNINNALDFQFYADKYRSQVYQIDVLPAPVLKAFSIDVVPPSYTGVESQRLLNAGDITVPFGTDIKWNFTTNNVNSVKIIYNQDTVSIESENEVFTNRKQILKNTNYSVIFANENFVAENVLEYTINVIPDQFPEILLKQVEDSLKVGAYYYMVSVKDDYGFNDLHFVAEVISSDSSVTKISEKLPVNKLNKVQDVFYYYNFNDIEFDSNEDSHVEYYFEIRDNDYISGFKAARTPAKIFKPLSADEIRAASEEYESKTDDAIAKSKELTKSIQKELEDFKRKELRGEVNQWEKQNFLKNIVEKQKKLDDLVEKISENNEKKNSLNNQFYKEQNDIIEKQKQIQELLDEILDDELKELLKEIEELSKKFDDKKFEQAKDKLDLSYKNLDEKLDRSLELLKRYQIEENVKHLSEDLEKLADKQQELSEHKMNKKTEEGIQNKQKQLKEEFKETKEDFNNTEEKNNELKNPYKFEKFDEKFEEIQEKMDELEQNMPSNSKKKNKQQQQEISKEMKQMSKQMQDMFNQMNMQSLNMNMQDLRQLIDNLSTFSFNQEDNYNLLNKNFSNSPQYPDIVSKQDKIKKDYDLIRDSLSSLAKRIPQMSQLITKESEKIQFDLEKANKEIEERHRRSTLRLQRLIMNSTNTLALYLDELMQQMQNQMQNSGSGKGQPMPQQAMQNLKQQQQKLKEQLEQLLEQMKQEGGKKPGGEMNKQIVKTLAEQEIFNKMLQDLQNGKSISPEGEQKLKEIKKLSDKNIEDLINKSITPELFKRNERIKTRLLEAEKSEREREQEKKRESKEGKKKDLVVPEELKESLKKNQNYKESLQKNSLNMKKYYENLSKEYFRNINE